MVPSAGTFWFEDMTWDAPLRRLRLQYSFDGTTEFIEEIIFPEFGPQSPEQEAGFLRAARLLWIMAGVSYFKAALPHVIALREGGLTEREREFFQKAYTLGLGQFFYQNEIDPRSAVQFPEATEMSSTPLPLPELTGSLVALGGGKDSVLSAEILKVAGEPFDTFTVGDYAFFQPQIALIGSRHHTVLRRLSPTLLELNAAGALNGHVPITAVISLIGVCLAILQGRRAVIFSNDQSTDEVNVLWNETPINHQFSKTLEFERMLQAVLASSVSPDVSYCSLLRPLSQLRIAELFSQHALARYSGHFSSCNTNFRIAASKEGALGWCGKCPKCAFVYLIFAASSPRAELVALFGHDLFGDPDLLPTFRELLGISGIKPFECVGEIQECRAAWQAVASSGEYPLLPALDFPPLDYDYAAYGDSALPTSLDMLLKRFLERFPPCI